MPRFDYANDAAPAAFEWLRAAVASVELRAPLFALATSIAIAVGAGCIEHARMREAEQAEALQQVRVSRTELRLAQARLESQRIDALVALDARLRSIRLSGPTAGAHLAEIANRIPSNAWLTAIGSQSGRVVLDGRTMTLDALGGTLALLMTNKSSGEPSLIKADETAQNTGPRTVSFEIALGQSTAR